MVRLILLSFPCFGLLRPNAFRRAGSILRNGAVGYCELDMKRDVPPREPCPAALTAPV